MSTRPDIATITNLLSHHLHTALPGHVVAAKHVLRYLIDTIDLGIEFLPLPSHMADVFVKFPLDPNNITSLPYANWSPQYQSIPNLINVESLDLFKS